MNEPKNSKILVCTCTFEIFQWTQNLILALSLGNTKGKIVQLNSLNDSILMMSEIDQYTEKKRNKS